MTFLAELVATLASGLFAVAEFGPSYSRAAVMQATLAIVGTLAAIAAWLLAGALAWLASALFLFAVVPFTLVVIFPTNAKLLDPALDRSSPEARELLERWGRLHAVRSALSLGAFVLAVVTAID